jgi:starch-binding outer membrane protein, SusD/RagB family
MKTYIKYITSLILVASTFLMLSSCEKELVEEPPSRYTLENLNKEKIEAIIVGAYEPLSRSRGRLWESSLMRAIEIMGEYGVPPAGALDNYTKYVFEPLRNDGQNPWITFYDCIGKCNLAIQTIEADKNLSPAIKDPFKSEAMFVRAICYYNLVRLWGPVPLRLKPILNSNDTALALSDEKTIYDQIISDLLICEKNLPDKVSESKAGRATAGAAKVFLADVYLTQKDYAKAREKAKEVIDNRAKYGYALVTSLNTLYSPTAATNSEEVFAIKFSQQVGFGSFIPAYIHDDRALAAGFAARGLRFMGVTAKAPLVSQWNRRDLRFGFNLYDSLVVNGVKVRANVIAGTNYFYGKYKDPGAPEETAAGNDFYLFRYADALLILAESENQLNGPTAVAYDAVNQIRRRGYGVNLAQTSALADLPANLSKTDFDDLVFRERGYEFMAECKRWFDMVRTGRAAAIATAAGRPAPTRTNWFIPNIEIANNPLIK